MTAAGVAERRPHRSRLDHPDLPASSFRRGELAAGLAAVAVVVQLALAPVTLLVAASLALVGRIARWQPAWLLLPALGGACWLAIAGLPATVHALIAGAARLMAAELAVAAHPMRLLHPAAAFAGTGRELPQELPLQVLAGTAEAAIALWLGSIRRSRTGWQRAPGWRPGLGAALRRRAAVAALAAGHTVTADGCAIGVDYYSGLPAAISWTQAERGVLLTGSDQAELGKLGLAITCAALHLRKAVLVLDLSADRASQGQPRLAERGASVCAQVALLAERLGVPVTYIGSVADRPPALPGASTCGAVSLNGAFGRAIRSRGVVLVREAQPAAAQSETTQQALSDLAGTLTSLRELGLRGDCLAWVIGCQAADASGLSDLLSLGPATGIAVVLSATNPGLAADLAAEAEVVVASGPITGDLAQCLAASVTAKRVFTDILQGQHRNSATLIAGGRVPGLVSFRMVPVEVTEVR